MRLLSFPKARLSRWAFVLALDPALGIPLSESPPWSGLSCCHAILRLHRRVWPRRSLREPDRSAAPHESGLRIRGRSPARRRGSRLRRVLSRFQALPSRPRNEGPGSHRRRDVGEERLRPLHGPELLEVQEGTDPRDEPAAEQDRGVWRTHDLCRRLQGQAAVGARLDGAVSQQVRAASPPHRLFRGRATRRGARRNGRARAPGHAARPGRAHDVPRFGTAPEPAGAAVSG